MADPRTGQLPAGSITPVLLELLLDGPWVPSSESAQEQLREFLGVGKTTKGIGSGSPAPQDRQRTDSEPAWRQSLLDVAAS